jgi:general secretion pathway protein A
MYLDYFGFSETPFSLTPNPRFIFFSKTHKEAFALLLYGINKRFGFTLLLGEVGTGKTTVLRTLLGQLHEERHRTALIFNPSLSAVDLMRTINREFGLPCQSGNIAELLGELNGFLLQENAEGRTVVLIVDEAQNLAPDVLEQLRLISNLETDANKLIQIILAGQPELGRLLEMPQLRQLNQRIALRYDLSPLDREDCLAYIGHRLGLAGGSGKVSFTPAAGGRLHRYSGGTPRLINILCDRALLIGYTGDRRKMTARTIDLAYRDVMLKPAHPSTPHFWKWAAASVVAALLTAGGYGYLTRVPPPTMAKPATAKVVSQAEVKKPAVAAPAAAAVQPALTTVRPALTTVQLAATTGQPAAPAVKEPPRDGLAARQEMESAVRAFNALASFWRVAPVGQLSERTPPLQQIPSVAKKRGLELAHFYGNLDDLLHLDFPALLPLSAKEKKGRVLVALLGNSNGMLQIHPALMGRSSYSKAEIVHLWSGHAYFLWRNGKGIPCPLTRGAEGEGVTRLQTLLQTAGFSEVQVSGFFDELTEKALRDFQVSRKISTTGKVGPITLIQLYKAGTGDSFPSLATAGKGGGQ